MPETAVVTITMGEHAKLAHLTHPTIKAYADKIGADFVVIKDRLISQTTPHWEKFQIYHMLSHYKRIIYLDTDIIVRDDCPNLFEVVPENKLGVFNEGPFTDRRGAMQLAAEQYQTKLDDWDGVYFNSGVMVVSRQQRDIFVKPSEEIFNFYEQSYLNLRAHKLRIELHKLNYNFNRMSCMDSVTGMHRLASYIVHYAGCPGMQQLMEIISNDLKKWESGDRTFKRNILIKVHGGLGDEIAAEPVIRHMAEKMYKGQNIHVMTWFPRIYKHLPVKVHKMGKFEYGPDTQYFVMNTLVPTSHLSWMFMTVSLMQPIDYISLLLLKRVLPDDEKQTILQVDEKDVEEMRGLVPVDLEKLIVVHPGKGWDSKTFPAEWYDKIIDELLAAGRKVAIIGRWMNEDQGTVAVNVKKPGVYDLRNLMTLGGMFALLSKSCVLISNDSSPVHAAGAFDNHIILIPSCKHPDHVIPVRKGMRYHKAVALYKKLTCEYVDSSPTMVEGEARMDGVVGDIYDYLPDPKAVAAEAVKRSDEFYR